MALVNSNPFVNEQLSKVVEPLLTDAELKIKLIIRNSVVNRRPTAELQGSINWVITGVMARLPQETPNKDAIFLGLRKSSTRWYNEVRNELAPIMFKLNQITGGKFNGSTIERAVAKFKPDTRPLSLRSLPEIRLENYDELWKQLDRLDTKLAQLADYGLTTDFRPGTQQPMSLYANLEMANRLNNNLGQLREKLLEQEQVVRFSQHRDASERCSIWQGRLVDLIAPAINNPPRVVETDEIKSLGKGKGVEAYRKQFETGRFSESGEPIYSYQAITQIQDEYGYQNNIHVGFNCRHSLKKQDDRKPDPFTKEQIQKARLVNFNMRKLERSIRDMKKKYALMLTAENRAKISKRITEATKYYIDYAEKNGFKPIYWRLTV